jgi:hypothetical protein
VNGRTETNTGFSVSSFVEPEIALGEKFGSTRLLKAVSQNLLPRYGREALKVILSLLDGATNRLTVKGSQR